MIEGSYFEPEDKLWESDRDGVRVVFCDRPLPLERLAGALEAAGLLIEAIREPRPGDEFVRDASDRRETEARPAVPPSAGGEAVTWEAEARNWIAWARAPRHDAYWEYSPRFFELVPAAGRATLEIGCGEGRVARDLAARGHRVTGVDASADAARGRPRGAGGRAISTSRTPLRCRSRTRPSTWSSHSTL